MHIHDHLVSNYPITSLSSLSVFKQLGCSATLTIQIPDLNILQLAGIHSQSYYTNMVQLKGNFTHADRAHATYWLKAHGYINPYWHVQKGKPANIIIFKRQECGLRRYSREYIPIPFSVYVIHTQLLSVFSLPTLCATSQPVLPCLTWILK